MRELSLSVLDIAQNSISAGADLTKISVITDTAADRLTVTIEDNGCGMTPEQVRNVTDPFFTTRTTRRVGMGVPLFKLAAEQTGGSLSISSEVGKGTVTSACFVPSHVDMTPVGDMNSTIAVLIRLNPTIDFIYEYGIDGRSFTLDTRELREQLGDVPLNNEDVLAWIAEYLTENTDDIKNGGNIE